MDAEWAVVEVARAVGAARVAWAGGGEKGVVAAAEQVVTEVAAVEAMAATAMAEA